MAQRYSTPISSKPHTVHLFYHKDTIPKVEESCRTFAKQRVVFILPLVLSTNYKLLLDLHPNLVIGICALVILTLSYEALKTVWTSHVLGLSSPGS